MVYSLNSGSLVTVIVHLNSRHMVYSLDSGSLLGAYRHHGVIPYEYDLDVIVHLPLSVANAQVDRKACENK